MASKYPTFEVEQVKPAGYLFTLQLCLGRGGPIALVQVTAETYRDAVAAVNAAIRVENAIDLIPTINLDHI